MTIDLHSLVAPYALDALEPLERSRFEAHLEACADCREELAGFQATAVRLGDTVRHAPPAGLRERLLAEIATTPQERPVAAVLAQRRGLRRTLPRLAMAAAFLVGTVGVGGYVVEHRQAQEARQATDDMSRIIGASDVVVSSMPYKSGSIKLFSSPSADGAVVIAKDLPAPAGGRVYQVWMVKDSTPTSKGTFATSGEMTMKGVAGSDHIAVTIEPAGGSKQPTSAPVAIVGI